MAETNTDDDVDSRLRERHRFEGMLREYAYDITDAAHGEPNESTSAHNAILEYVADLRTRCYVLADNNKRLVHELETLQDRYDSLDADEREHRITIATLGGELMALRKGDAGMNDAALLTVNEAAAKLGVTVGAVYQRIKAGQLAMVEKYGLILIPRHEVEKWRKERIEAATTQLEKAGG